MVGRSGYWNPVQRTPLAWSRLRRPDERVQTMSDGYVPVKGKCTWWREMPSEDDRFDSRLKKGERRVMCSCFVEGKGWALTQDKVPADCPEYRHCRYYIKFL